MNKKNTKLNDKSGVTLILALVFFLLATVITSLFIVAASTNATRAANDEVGSVIDANNADLIATSVIKAVDYTIRDKKYGFYQTYGEFLCGKTNSGGTDNSVLDPHKYDNALKKFGTKDNPKKWIEGNAEGYFLDFLTNAFDTVSSVNSYSKTYDVDLAKAAGAKVDLSDVKSVKLSMTMSTDYNIDGEVIVEMKASGEVYKKAFKYNKIITTVSDDESTIATPEVPHQHDLRVFSWDKIKDTVDKNIDGSGSVYNDNNLSESMIYTYWSDASNYSEIEGVGYARMKLKGLKLVKDLDGNKKCKLKIHITKTVYEWGQAS